MKFILEMLEMNKKWKGILKMLWYRLKAYKVRLLRGKYIQMGRNVKLQTRVKLLVDQSQISLCDNCLIKESSILFSKRGAKIVIGKNTSIGKNNEIASNCSIEIGSDCIFGANVYVTDSNHEYKTPGVLFKDQGMVSEKVVIGDNVWVGRNAMILKGVHIGSNSIVAAGAVVTKSFPDFTIIGGNPAKIIKEIETREKNTNDL